MAEIRKKNIKTLSKYIVEFDYFDKILLVLSAASGFYCPIVLLE